METIVTTPEEYQKLRQILTSSKEPIVVDIETNWTDVFEKRSILGIAIWAREKGYYLPLAHTNYFGEQTNLGFTPRDLLQMVDSPIIFHNAKFDIQFLEREGIKVPRENVFDTMIIAHYVNEDIFPKNFALDNLARIYDTDRKASQISKSMKSHWDDMIISVMAKYAVQDCLTTYQLYKKLLPDFKTYQSLWEETDRDFMYLLMDMERKGILVDVQKCQELEIQTLDRMQKIEEELGFDPTKPAALREKLFSDPPWGYGLTPLSFTPKKNEPQVNKYFLENTNHPVCGLILEYRELTKQVTSYFRPYQEKGELAGRMHPSFRQHGTVTGRLSCAEPNLQQVPRDSKIKTMFMPEENCDLVEIDYSNLEMRLMSVYIQDPHLLKVFSERDGDVHQTTADLIGIPRYDAKQANFTIGYGGGWFPLDKYVKKGEKESRRIIDAWHKTYPGVKKASRNAQEAATRNRGVVRMWTGRERHFPSSNDYHKAFNAVIQGGAFEIVKRSGLMLDKAGFDLRNQVHDSWWLNHSDEDIQEAERIMEGWVEEEFGLPFFVESKILRSRKSKSTT